MHSLFAHRKWMRNEIELWQTLQIGFLFSFLKLYLHYFAFHHLRTASNLLTSTNFNVCQCVLILDPIIRLRLIQIIFWFGFHAVREDSIS